MPTIPFALENLDTEAGRCDVHANVCHPLNKWEAGEKREVLPISESAVPLILSAFPSPIKELRSCTWRLTHSAHCDLVSETLAFAASRY
jgi:hypothetical protein